MGIGVEPTEHSKEGVKAGEEYGSDSVRGKLTLESRSGFKVKWKVRSKRFCMQVPYRSGLNTSG